MRGPGLRRFAPASGLLLAFACLLAAPASAQFIERKELSYAAAKAAAENALEACKARGYAVSVAVVDRGGLTVVSLRADGASPHTMENARRKAYTAMTFKMTTAEFIKRMATEPVRREQTTLPNVIAIDGGVPIKAGNDVVGGIGMALLEATIWDPRNARVVNANLADYHVPVNADIP